MSNNRNLGNIATAITNATSGQVLTSQGNGVATFADAAGGSSVTTVTNVSGASDSLTAISSPDVGDIVFVTSTNGLFIRKSNGWFKIADVTNAQPTNLTGVSDSALAIDGTATTITLAATDPEGLALTFSAAAKTGSSTTFSAALTDGNTVNALNGSTVIATVAQASNVFTITPNTSNNAGIIDITFSVTDGINTALTDDGQFTLSFVTIVTDSNHTTLLATATGTSDNNNITDSSSNSHSITVNGDAHAGTFSPYRSGGYSTYFDGSGDSLNTTATQIIPSTSFTVTAWVYLNDTTDGAVWGQGTAGHSGRTGVTIDNNNWFAQIGSANLGTSTSVSANRWYYTDLQWDGSTLKFFVDGTLLGSVSNSNSPTNSAFYIGDLGSAWSTGYPLNGYVSDLKVVSGTPSGSSTVPTSPLSSDSAELHICHLPYISDGSTNNHSITSNGDVSTKPFSPYDYDEYADGDHGGSVYFDTSDDYLTVPNGSWKTYGSSNFTIECWFYTDRDGMLWGDSSTSGLGDNCTVIADLKDFSGANAWVQVEFRVGSTKYGINPAQGTFKRKAWNHIAFVRNGNTFTVYSNGKDVGNTSQSGSMNTSSSDWAIASGWSSTAGSQFNGYISDFRISKSARYTAEFTPPTAPLSSTGAELHIKGTDASIIDKSQSSNLKLEGSTTGSTTQVKFSNTKSMYFDGSGDYITTPTSDFFTYGTNDFTTECWVYIPSHPSNYSYLFAQGNSTTNTNSFGVYIQSGVFKIWNGGNIFTGTTSYSLNTWTHLAISRSGNSLKLYINGNQEGSSVTNTSNISTGSSNGIEIARWIGISDPNYFTGYLQDLRVTKGLARYTASDETSNIPSAPLEG